MNQSLSRESAANGVLAISACALVLAAGAVLLPISSPQFLSQPKQVNLPGAVEDDAGLDTSITVRSELQGDDTKQHVTTIDSPITERDRREIIAKLKSVGMETEIGEIRRTSVDSFAIELTDLDGTFYLSLRPDNIRTEGELTTGEIETIKEIALRHRSSSTWRVRTIQQTSPDTVHVMTGSSVAGDSMLFERNGNLWELISAGRWVE